MNDMRASERRSGSEDSSEIGRILAAPRRGWKFTALLASRFKIPRPFHATDAQGKAAVPAGAALLLRGNVLGVLPPGTNRFQARPIRHRDALAVRIACTFDAEKSRLLTGQLQHSLSRLRIALGIVWRSNRT